MTNAEYQDFSSSTPDSRRLLVRKFHHVFAPSEATATFITDHFEEGTAPRVRIIGSKTVAIPGELYYGNGLEQTNEWWVEEKPLTVHEKITLARKAFQSSHLVQLGNEGRVRADETGIRFAFKAARQVAFDELLSGIDTVVRTPDINSPSGYFLIAEAAAGGLLVSRARRRELYETYAEKMADERARLFYVTPLDISGFDERVARFTAGEENEHELPKAS